MGSCRLGGRLGKNVLDFPIGMGGGGVLDFIILESFFDGPLKDMRGMALLLPFFEDQDRS